jgi:hypothetical protein
VKVGRSVVEVDVGATKKAYARLSTPGPEECGCSYCRNWAATREIVYTAEVKEFLESMGITPGYETEVWEAPSDNDRHYYSGWYPFVGDIMELDEEHERIGQVEFWVSRNLSYSVPWVSGDRVHEVHFSAVVDWIIGEPPETEP